MNKKTIGAIDIGSNAIRLLINFVEKEEYVSFKKATFIRVPIRLGEDVFTKGFITEEKKERLIDALQAFKGLLKAFRVESFRACATSAMREATNSNEIVEEIAKNCGINLEIISGKEEAETIFNAAVMSSNKNYLYVDVGGGSTEITIYCNGTKVDSESFPLGTVRMISNATNKSEWKRFTDWLANCEKRFRIDAIIGSGGNINKINKILQKRENEYISYQELKKLNEKFSELSYEERISRYGLNEYRADVIMPAMKIFLTVAKHCCVKEIRVPKIGLADGMIRKLYAEKYKK